MMANSFAVKYLKAIDMQSSSELDSDDEGENDSMGKKSEKGLSERQLHQIALSNAISPIGRTSIISSSEDIARPVAAIFENQRSVLEFNTSAGVPQLVPLGNLLDVGSSSVDGSADIWQPELSKRGLI